MHNDALGRMHKNVGADNMLRGTHAQNVNNSKSNVAPSSAVFGDYVEVSAHSKRDHTLQSG